MQRNKLFLIDAHSFCYRAYYAIKTLSTSHGEPTNAIYGFVIMLKKILKKYNPDYAGVCFDVGKKTLRQKKFAEYKIARTPMPEDLANQIPKIKEVIKAFNIATFELEGYEADDIIATIAKKLANAKLDVYIVSGDKDMLQLVDNNIFVINPNKEDSIFDINEVKKIYNFGPEKIADLFALMGDKTDNIPGVRGIGEVTAKDLIGEFGSLEDLLANLNRVKQPSIKEAIGENKSLARLSKDLAILDTKVPIEFEIRDLKVGEPNSEQLFRLYKEFEFKSLLKELPALKVKDYLKDFKYKTIKDREALSNITKEKLEFAFSLEVSSTNPFNVKILGLNISYGNNEIIAVEPEDEILGTFFSDENTKKIGYDLKQTQIILLLKKIELKGKLFDIKIASYLLDPAKTTFSIEDLVWEYLGNDNKNLELDKRALVNYIFRLKTILQERLEEKSLLELYNNVEIPLSCVLANMEFNGVNIDKALLKKLSLELDERLNQLTSSIYDLSGEKFNLNSPKQLRNILFVKLKLPIIKKTKTGASTDEEVLNKLKNQHKLPSLLLEYRQLIKLKSSYIDTLPTLINPVTGRIHACFEQTGTETGRLSSHDPNLQNIPIKADLGKKIRQSFIPRDKDNLLISADYSQIELRILAHLSGDENLIKAFKNDQDIHKFSAALIFNTKQAEITEEMRDIAKRVNFGIIYGISAYGLSRDLGISQEEAQNFIDAYFMRYPKVKDYMLGQIKKVRNAGYCCTILGRRRYLPEINSSHNTVRQFAERQAINTPVQGSAADLIKLAMINIQNQIIKHKLDAKIIIQVHDELVFDIPENELNIMKELVKNCMENCYKLNVPIKAIVKSGKNWLEMENI